MPYEMIMAVYAMRKSRRGGDDGAAWVPKTARLPPMSWEQIKCAEAIFEALPQSMLQAYVVISDLYHDRVVTPYQIASLLSSYGNVAIVLSLMGPPNIAIPWRIMFGLFVWGNVVLRSVSLAFVTILDDLYFDNYNSVLYIAGSYVVTAFFVFTLQGKKMALNTMILSIIAFLCPVDISRFTVLSTAQPRPAQLPFATLRFLEIFACCAWFVSLQTHSCVLSTDVSYLDVVDVRGRRNISAAPTVWAANGTFAVNTINHTLDRQNSIDTSSVGSDDSVRKRWVLFDNPEHWGGLPEQHVIPRSLFPFNIGVVLSLLGAFNVISYLLTIVLPYKKIDPVPHGLQAICAKGSEFLSIRHYVRHCCCCYCRRRRSRPTDSGSSKRYAAYDMVIEFVTGIVNVENSAAAQETRAVEEQAVAQSHEDQAAVVAARREQVR
jgi:hypothetical protein